MIVNVKVKNIRPTYNNLQEWINDPNNVYVGRRGIVFIDKKRFPPEDSEWCNPYKITNDLSREECLLKYKKYLHTKLKDEDTLERFKLLKGKNLGCWCAPEQCHANIIKIYLSNI